MFQNLLKGVLITRVMNAVAAGTSDQNGTGVDMSGWDGVMFIAALGTLSTGQVTAMHAQQSSDDGSTDSYSDLEGSEVGPMADDDDNQCLVLDIYRPQKRYVRPVLDRATANAVIDGIIAIQYRGRFSPMTQGATIMDALVLASPDEGTP